MTPQWRIFWRETLRSLRFVFGSIAVIPLFYFLLDHEWNDPSYFRGMIYSMRIGSEVAFFSWGTATLIWAAVLKWRPSSVSTFRESTRMRILVNAGLMIVGLALVGLVEPYVSGVTWKLKSYSIGLLIGGSTIVIISLMTAYGRVKEQNLKLRAQSAEAGFNILKLQMQPHFLFNSLNSLAALVDQDPAHASEVTQKLADLYRKILDLSNTSLASLDQDIEVARLYLEIEKIRFGDRLNFRIDVVGPAGALAIPSLTLQTLVENAVKHGIARSLEGGRIEVRILDTEKGSVLEVRNTGAALIAGSIKEGTGLRNTRERLSSMGLGKDAVFLGEENGWTVARIPLGITYAGSAHV